MNLAIMKKRKNNPLEKQPYAAFLKSYKKIERNLINQKIDLEISSDKGENAGEFIIQSVYCETFKLGFQYYLMCNEKQDKEFWITHTIVYSYLDDCEDTMYYLIEDIQNMNGFYYLSDKVEHCDVNCSINSRNKVFITYNVKCEMDDAREVSLQLLSQDIAMFTRTF